MAYTDFKLLTFTITGTSNTRSPHQSRHISFISEFTTDRQHIKGNQSIAADALSLVPLDTTMTMSLDNNNMAALLENDPAIQAYRTAITELCFEDIPELGSNCTLLCDFSQLFPLLIIPDLLHRLVFDTVHNLAHPGIKPTKQIITQNFVWQGINKNIAYWVCSRPASQLAMIHRHTITPLDQFVLLKGRFDCIHVAIVVPLLQSHGHNYLSTIINHFTCWPEAIPMVDRLLSPV